MRKSTLAKLNVAAWEATFQRHEDTPVVGVMGKAGADPVEALRAAMLKDLHKLDEILQLVAKELQFELWVKRVVLVVLILLIVGSPFLAAFGLSLLWSSLISGGSIIVAIGWWFGMVRQSERERVQLKTLVKKFIPEVQGCTTAHCLRGIAKKVREEFQNLR